MQNVIELSEYSKETVCSVLLSGRQGNSDLFRESLEFDLQDALMTEGQPIHNIAIRRKLSGLEKGKLRYMKQRELLDCSTQTRGILSSRPVKVLNR